MRIKSIHQTSEMFNDGLSTIDMLGLNHIVIIAGANGSGKSRLLQRVQYGGHPGHQHTHYGNGFELEFVDESVNPVSFVSKELILLNPANITRDQILQLARQAESPGMNSFAQATLPYIQRVQNNWWNATHQNSSEDPSIIKEKIESYKSLCQLIYIVLGKSLERDDDNPILFNKPIFEAGLSDGQKLLLQWCTAIHSQGSQLSELILLINSPDRFIATGGQI
jgi:hypothetical protein